MYDNLKSDRKYIFWNLKITKQTGNTLKNLKGQITEVQNQLTKCQQDLQSVKEHISNAENEIGQLEMLKCHVWFRLYYSNKLSKNLIVFIF